MATPIKYAFVLWSVTTVALGHAQTLQTEQVADLPSILDESSGLAHHGDHTFWSHNDSGTEAELYRVDTSGQLLQTLAVNATNVDWEELTTDADGNIYIGDFGNNANTRTDLRVYRVSTADLNSGGPVNVDTIRFSYGDQLAFPPTAVDMHFDMEAMVWWNDTLHLFSKDRSSPHAGITRHYRLPATPGDHTILPQETFSTGQGSYIMAVTGAALSADGQRLVLLNANSIWMFTDFNGTDFFSGQVQQLLLGSFTQKEAVCWVGDMLYLTDERSVLSDGFLYRVNPDLFVGINDSASGHDLQAVYGVDGNLEAVSWTHGQPRSWQLYAMDGRRLAQGDVGTRQRSVRCEGLAMLATGNAVMHFTYADGRMTALLVSLR